MRTMSQSWFDRFCATQSVRRLFARTLAGNKPELQVVWDSTRRRVLMFLSAEAQGQSFAATAYIGKAELVTLSRTQILDRVWDKTKELVDEMVNAITAAFPLAGTVGTQEENVDRLMDHLVQPDVVTGSL